MIRQRWMGGNWKMNGNQKDLTLLIEGLQKMPVDFSKTDIVVFPPFVYLPMIQAKLASKPGIHLGAQTLNENKDGAYTGEISAGMLKDIGTRYVLVGHSERRQYYGETSQKVAEKFKTAFENGLIPVLCVGETRQEREAGKTEQVIQEQLSAVIQKVNINAFEKAVIAYEPVWAIGTGLTATPEQAEAVHLFIRNQIAALNKTIAQNIRIVYGGSMKPDNVKGLLAMPNIDGGLVGGASLKVVDFTAICQATQN